MIENKKHREIIKKYPELFGEPPFETKNTLIGFGFEINDGWLSIIEEGLKKLSEVVKRDNLTDFRIRQIKEKFGGLRIHCNYYTDEIDDIINNMELQATRTCERCGSKGGVLREKMFMATLCDKCYNEIEEKRLKKNE